MSIVADPGAGQTVKSNLTPRVGTIKDYPATGMMTGCGNLYFYKLADAKSTSANYVFLARGDGRDAWMNINGRDVRLRRIKPGARDRKAQRYSYRFGQTRISVVIEEPKTQAEIESDNPYKMTIILRSNGSVRTVRAVGSSDC